MMQRNASASRHLGVLCFVAFASSVRWCGSFAYPVPRLDSFGMLFEPLAYASWFATTPCLVLLLGELAHAPVHEVKHAILLDVMMLASGLISQLAPPHMLPLSMAALTLSFLCWMPLMRNLDGMFVACLKRAGKGTMYHRAASLCRVLTLASWTMFPTIWVLYCLKALGPGDSVVGFAAADVLAKTSFTFALLHAHTVTLDESSERTEHAVTSAKSRQLAHMCHEIRNPLNGIIGNLQEMELEVAGPEAEAIPPSISSLLETTLACTAQLRRSLDDFLDLEKASAAALRIEKGPSFLRELMRDAARQVRRAAAGKGLSVRIEVAPELRGRAYLLDPGRVMQVMANYAWNAVKSTSSGGVVLRVMAAEGGQAIKLGAAQGEHLLHFEVQDTGPGLSAEASARIFKPFEQKMGASGARSEEAAFGGSGLGLHICKVLSELLGGTVGYHSTSAGATFWMRIPAEWHAAVEKEVPGAAEFEAGFYPTLAEPLPEVAGVAAGEAAAEAPPDPVKQWQSAPLRLRRRGSASEAGSGGEGGRTLSGGAAEPGPGEVLVLNLVRSMRATCEALEREVIAQPLRRQQSGMRPSTSEETLAAYNEAWVPLNAASLAALGGPSPPRSQSSASGSAERSGSYATATWPGERHSVLVVDDEPVNAALIVRRLQREMPDVGVTMREDGKEFVTLCVEEGARFDLVLMDQNMRGMNGDVAVALLREREAREGLPRARVVAWTGNASDRDVDKLSRAGFDGVVTKPVDMSLVVPLLNALVAGGQLPHHLSGLAKLFGEDGGGGGAGGSLTGRITEGVQHN